MRKILFLLLITFSLQTFAQEKTILEKPNVDKRVELLSIVFRLAGKREYSSSQFKFYNEKIDIYFDKFKDHELIQFTKSVMNENGIGYDAVMSMALHLDNNMKLQKNIKDNWRDSRWKKEIVEKFIPLLYRFYKDTKYETFFKDNTDLYAKIVSDFLPVYKQLDLNWYQSFFGKEPTETFRIIIGLGNWDCNYGPSVDYTNEKRNVYAVMGIWRIDSIGMPEFRVNEYFPIILHEFNHPFVNYLTEKNRDAFKQDGELIFSVLKEKMTRQAYGNWQTMLNEALVRAAVIKYMKDHNYEKFQIDNEINKQKSNGFLWIEGLVNELENYDKQRNIYPTLESYMPKLIEKYGVWAKEIQNLENKIPKVVL